MFPLRTEELDYELPDELIARRPLAERDASRLLVLDRGSIQHRAIKDWPALLPERALVVLNDTRVRRARMFGQRRESGGKVELLLLGRHPELESGAEGEVWEALGRASKPLRQGLWLDAGALACQVLEKRDDGTLLLAISAARAVEQILAEQGRVPIPPYLGRDDDEDDVTRYQTVYAERVGSVAAPTAGLHLTEALLAAMKARGIEFGRLELEVGLGTFRPVVAEDLAEHVMHQEQFAVTAQLAEQIGRARAAGRAVVAVGTTVVRALESAADSSRPGHVLACSGATRLLIQPGYAFQVVDALLTNFHQPKSTLLALVAAFVGLDAMRTAYATAVAERYRFLSFGDAMWLPRRAS
ncbi:MAG TPA: tRNA preQ1(34) S-adenosylmethionine ribosyltransferase-isomerase QueA [Polyangiaceae bacterium]|nr:tRNA preQ1(34) S-adenosylmethionine ribosyltransferase-isomerase QueA [Polyangiaceae bacterium]